MQNRGSFFLLRWISVILIIIAVVLTAFQLVRYSRIRSNFSPGMVIAGIPVGGLDTQQASERLLQAYTAVPVEVRYRDAVIQIRPSAVGFNLDLESMMAAADLERVSRPFWTGFWDYLWNRRPVPTPVPLISSISEDRLRSFWRMRSPHAMTNRRHPPCRFREAPAFRPDKPGTLLDVNRAVVLDRGCFSLAQRSPGEPDLQPG